MKSINLVQVTKRKSLTHELADSLREEIVSGRLKIGDKLPSSKIIEQQAGVSRSVVREAVAQLRAEGLLDSRQGVGVFVSNIIAPTTGFDIGKQEMQDIQNAIHVIELRMAVEVEMSAKAAVLRSDAQMRDIRDCYDRMQTEFAAGNDAVEEDFAFHQSIASASGNPYFKRFIDFIGASVVPAREIITAHDKLIDRKAFIRDVSAEHKCILDAIINKDPVAAKKAAQKHLSNSMQRHGKVAQSIEPKR